ncbi:NAD(P)H-hydrate dehydratase [Novosphingobium sp.]|uniref:NAD(P)H-hydrate dehydratase n=1 Tax=Novosphingobium sp. TaxID=1874826 RepID=UPI00333E9ACE
MLRPHPDPAHGLAPHQVLTVVQMRGAEQALIDAGDTVDSLMQRAGHGAGDWVFRMAAGRPVTVLCGPGNNGGDGYVIAQHLAARGVPVQVIAALPPRTPAAIAARAAFGGAIHDGMAVSPPGAQVFVDCLFGSGLARPIDDELYAMLTTIALQHTYRIAIDVPSGVESDSGANLNPALAYDLTLALGAWKHAHYAMPAAASMGVLRLVDIGCGAMPGAAQVLYAPKIAAPAADAHKYRRGLLAVVGGAMPGAAVLATLAARHAGAGYVKLLAGTDPGAVPPDLVVQRDGDAGFALALADARVAAVLVGPGLGRDAQARTRLAVALGAGVPTVVDADALMLLRPGQAAAGVALVLTPHEGELAPLERAFGLNSAGQKRDRAARLADASGAVVVAKGPDTVIAAPDGRIMVAPRATPWLSVAGTGDVLAGIIASRLAVLRDPWRAAAEGVWLHAEAARRAGPAFAASDLAQWVQEAVRALV